jgi:hypothetical protein
MLMLETMLGDPEIFWFLNIYQSHREFHARAGAVTVHTTLTVIRLRLRIGASFKSSIPLTLFGH